MDELGEAGSPEVDFWCFRSFGLGGESPGRGIDSIECECDKVGWVEEVREG